MTVPANPRVYHITHVPDLGHCRGQEPPQHTEVDLKGTVASANANGKRGALSSQRQSQAILSPQFALPARGDGAFADARRPGVM